jgi:hypothetical protein
MDMTCSGDSLVCTSKATCAIPVFRPPPNPNHMADAPSARVSRRRSSAIISCSKYTAATSLSGTSTRSTRAGEDPHACAPPAIRTSALTDNSGALG